MVDREPALLGPTGPEPDADAGTPASGGTAAPSESVHEVPTRRVDAHAPTEPLTADRAATVRAPTPAPRAPTEKPRAPTARPATARPGSSPRRDAAGTVHVVGFWRRFAAAGVDLGVVVPVAALLTWITSAIAGVHIPRSNMHGPDFWLDLLLASDPALLMALGLFTAIGSIYLFVFQVTMGRTLGMHLLKIRVIDVFGDAPSNARCAIRTAGYLANALTLFLGFLWIGFDSEKRGLHDWIAGTYVIRG